MVKIELEVIVEEIRSLNDKVAKLEKTIADEGSKLEGHKNLTSIKGIGPLTGSILLSVIGDINDFEDEGKLAAYFGIVPRVSRSNETEHAGRITKRGSKLGRTALVQCALIAQRYSRYLKRYYEKIKARRGTGKAIIALARKLLGIVYRTLKNKWVFEDFPNFVLAEARNGTVGILYAAHKTRGKVRGALPRTPPGGDGRVGRRRVTMSHVSCAPSSNWTCGFPASSSPAIFFRRHAPQAGQMAHPSYHLVQPTSLI
jgi:hypothetical protein